MGVQWYSTVYISSTLFYSIPEHIPKWEILGSSFLVLDQE